jgi:hypothetical protein
VTPRLAVLFLRSRQSGLALGLILGAALCTWLGFAQTDRAGLTRYLAVFAPVVPAVILAVSAQTPFGEAERTAGRSLPLLRAGHLGGLLLWGGLLLALAGATEPLPGTSGILLRDGAAFAGIALLGARFLGPAASWLPAVAYAAVVSVGQMRGEPDATWWMWPMRDAGDGAALGIALGLLIAGLAAVAWYGAADRAGGVVG